jgi:hypothetical protein
MKVLILALIAAVSMVESAPGKDQRLRLRVTKHQPCTSQPTASERIRFPSIDQASLVRDPRRGDGCYMINGPVSVSKSITGTVQVYSEIRLGVKAPPEECQKADSAGCGGVGSCVYCDVCNSAKDIDKVSSGLVQLESTNGQALECQSGLKEGTYDNIRISFCMPTKAEVLKSQGIDEDFWEKNGASGRMFFVNLYVFDKKVNGLSATELQAMAKAEGDHVIGCHKIAGTIYEGDA